MPHSVRMVCEIDRDLISSYPIQALPWKPAANGTCGMIEDFPYLGKFLEIVRPHFKKSFVGFHAISKVIKGQTIQLHKDVHDGGCKVRIHIPLKTNPHSYFYTSRMFQHMQVGHAYVIDPSKEHGVVNLGHDDRVHLIFNMVN